MLLSAKSHKQSWLKTVVLKCSQFLLYCTTYVNVFHLRLQIVECYDFCLFIEQQKTDSQHFSSRPFIHRRPGPPTMVPSKNHVSSPLTNQLASINALFNSTQSQTLLQGHSHSTSSTTASGSSGNSATRSSMNEMSGHSNVGPGKTNNTKLSITVVGREKKWKHVACGFI